MPGVPRPPVRHYCVTCRRRRNRKFLYLIQLPFNFLSVWVCIDCYYKNSRYAEILQY